MSINSHKTIVIGITGGIACYKIADLCSKLAQQGFSVHVIMTKHATEFIAPLTFETLTGHRCLLDTFDRQFDWNVQHIALAKQADVMLIAPATANNVAKLANGIADDLLTTTVLAMDCPVLVAPSMNTKMYHHPATQQNLEKLIHDGYQVITPDAGMLACKDIGEGRLPEVSVLQDHIMQQIACEKDLTGLRLLITAGATREEIDPVRFVSNYSTGKMGCEVARIARWRGAIVTLILGISTVEAIQGVETISVQSAKQMFEVVQQYSAHADIIVKAAAVADFTPEQVQLHKIKKHQVCSVETPFKLTFKPTQDILSWVGAHKQPHQVVCGFAMETQHLIEQGVRKLRDKQADLIAANSLIEPGAGFGVDTNILTLITNNDVLKLDKMTKQQAADVLLTKLLDIYQKKQQQTS